MTVPKLCSTTVTSRLAKSTTRHVLQVRLQAVGSPMAAKVSNYARASQVKLRTWELLCIGFAVQELHLRLLIELTSFVSCTWRWAVDQCDFWSLETGEKTFKFEPPSHPVGRGEHSALPGHRKASRSIWGGCIMIAINRSVISQELLRSEEQKIKISSN